MTALECIILKAEVPPFNRKLQVLFKGCFIALTQVKCASCHPSIRNPIWMKSSVQDSTQLPRETAQPSIIFTLTKKKGFVLSKWPGLCFFVFPLVLKSSCLMPEGFQSRSYEPEDNSLALTEPQTSALIHGSCISLSFFLPRNGSSKTGENWKWLPEDDFYFSPLDFILLTKTSDVSHVCREIPV